MAELKERILKQETGPSFTKNVIIYITSSLIYCNGNDEVYLEPIPHLKNVDEIGDLNWCEFVIHRLSEEKLKWIPKTSFIGPLLFLVVSVQIHFLKFCFL